MSDVYTTESDCSSGCAGCKVADCSSRKTDSAPATPSKTDFSVPLNQYSNVKKVIGIVSGKGGVGKSFVTSYLSVLMNRKGYKTAILDGDITGPSIPKSFGIHEKAYMNELGIVPIESKNGTKVMSVNLLLDTEETPVVWRGPVIANMVKQFWTDVVWGDVDYLFVDMPPGTGDVPLTVFQSLPVDGLVIITSPQELVSMIVSKAVNMANTMEIPILGLVENYSYIECGNCKERISVFGTSHIEEIAQKFNLDVLAKVPIDPTIASHIDGEKVEDLSGDWLNELADTLERVHNVPKEEREEISISGSQVIAVPGEGTSHVGSHFGKAKEFVLYKLESGQLVDREVLPIEDEEGHEIRIQALLEKGVSAVICGGIGLPAMEMLMAAGVKVIPGATGDMDVAVSSYLGEMA